MAQSGKGQLNIRPLNEGGARELAFRDNVNKAQFKHDAKVHSARRRIGWIFSLVIIIVGVVSLTGGLHGYAAVSAQVESANQSLASAKSDKVKLTQTKKDMNDNTYLQKYVREKFMYSKNGEIVFSLPDTATTSD